MQLKIMSDTKNILLERREVKFKVIHKDAPTPVKNEIAKLLAAKLNADLELMFLKHFKTKFGESISEGLCLIYENKGAMINAEATKLLNPKKRVGDKGETQDNKKE